ncbi:4068_t:CDS:2 [Acaulospora morrowiae]|uniref:4068_t:CDS:1 n=1 Tax=Acaulospora morrowiae TaxID=94023 RepID=A0A9N9F545_9GLOM|nr:4068_t:CDS:2 [Acaulospora morrowiae]
MGSSISHCINVDLEPLDSMETSKIALSSNVLSLVPEFNSHDIDINVTTTVFVANLLEKAEMKLRNNEYMKYVSCLERATQLGSASAAAKLGLVYSRGIDSAIAPDYASAASYYFLSLKLVLMIPYNSWDITLLLEVVAGLTELYQSKLNNENDKDIISHGVKLMHNVDDKLQDPYFIRTLTHQEVQKRRAIRIHMNYCFALKAMTAGDVLSAALSFQECELVGECGYETADNLVKQSQLHLKIIESSLPSVPPICAECEYSPKDLRDIWKLITCPQCRENLKNPRTFIGVLRVTIFSLNLEAL